MRLFRLLFLCLMAGMVTLFSCSDSAEQKTEEDLTGTERVVNPVDLSSYSPRFRNIVKTDEGVFRGVTFYDSASDVIALEEGNIPDSSDANYLDYLFKISPLEEAEVLYFKSESGKINRIQLNVYPESTRDQADIFDEFEKYFSEKYGRFTEKQDEKIWKAPGFTVKMKKTGNRKVHDIQVDFEPAMERDEFALLIDNG